MTGRFVLGTRGGQLPETKASGTEEVLGAKGEKGEVFVGEERSCSSDEDLHVFFVFFRGGGTRLMIGPPKVQYT